MRHGSLFSGIGGFDLAAEWMGWENVFHCEWNEFGQKILKHYWPDAKSYGDITKTDFTEWRGKVDIVSGGFPCQPYSQAGKRKGKADDRHLWPEMLRAIREIQPRWILGENVPGLLNWERGMVLDEIKADLEAEGFEVFPSLVLPACGKNAPHRRDRLWIVAYSKNNIGNNEFRNEGHKARKVSEKRSYESFTASNTNIGSKSDIRRNNEEVCRLPVEKRRTENGSSLFGRNGFDNNGNVANTNNKGSQGSKISGGVDGIGENGDKLFTGLLQSAWQEFPTQSPICSRDDGVSCELDGITISKHRKESLMAYGNSVVPQVVYEIFKAIEEVDSSFINNRVG